MDPQKLLEQFLGPNALGGLAGRSSGGGGLGGLISGALGGLSGTPQRGAPAQQSEGGFLGGLGSGGIPGGMGGLAAGGLLGVLLGQKKMRKMAGGALGYGGAAVLGALAFRAFQNWQSGQAATQAPLATAADAPAAGSPFAPATGADGKPFALALIRSMIAAANADGHIGADEQKQIFEAANRAGLDADDKAFIFDALQRPATPAEIATLAKGPEQSAELYLAARLAIDPDHPQEKAFLQNLSQQLALPGDLVAHLEAQVTQSLGAPGAV
jgi:uncharacterized membrane protein YebE (DUF533 family)